MRVKSKEYSEFKKMYRSREIEHHYTSDDGEIAHWGTIGNPSHVFTTWTDDYGKEYLVVDHPNPISKNSYDRLKIFFEEINEENKEEI